MLQCNSINWPMPTWGTIGKVTNLHVTSKQVMSSLRLSVQSSMTSVPASGPSAGNCLFVVRIVIVISHLYRQWRSTQHGSASAYTATAHFSQTPDITLSGRVVDAEINKLIYSYHVSTVNCVHKTIVQLVWRNQTFDFNWNILGFSHCIVVAIGKF